jgi:Lrp/AsnC family transcriptional regulator, regulator for asnA, asnC and gidA
MDSRGAHKPARVDLLDQELIRLLGVDGRLANTEIARRLGVTEGTIRNRITRLIRDNVIRIGAWADPLRIGYQTYTMFEMQVSPRHIERVAERLAAFPEIYFLCICSGLYDIYAAACFRSSEHIHEFITQRLGSVPEIVRLSTSSITRVVKRESVLPMTDGLPPARRVGRPGRVPSPARRPARKTVPAPRGPHQR